MNNTSRNRSLNKLRSPKTEGHRRRREAKSETQPSEGKRASPKASGKKRRLIRSVPKSTSPSSGQKGNAFKKGNDCCCCCPCQDLPKGGRSSYKSAKSVGQLTRAIKQNWAFKNEEKSVPDDTLESGKDKSWKSEPEKTGSPGGKESLFCLPCTYNKMVEYSTVGFMAWTILAMAKESIGSTV